MNILSDLGEKQKNLLIKTVELLIKRIESEVPEFEKKLFDLIESNKETETEFHFFNVALLLRLSVFDLTLIFKSLINSKSESEQRLFAKLICSHLYEFIEDTLQILGKKFRKNLEVISNNKLTQELNELIKHLNEQKNMSHEFLKVVRNNIGSHKDPDAYLQVQMMKKLDIEVISMTYMNITKTFGEYYAIEVEIMKALE